jgi:hypothetical protein
MMGAALGQLQPLWSSGGHAVTEQIGVAPLKFSPVNRKHKHL